MQTVKASEATVDMSRKFSTIGRDRLIAIIKEQDEELRRYRERDDTNSKTATTKQAGDG